MKSLTTSQILEVHDYLYKSRYDIKDLTLEQQISFYNEIKFSNKIAYIAVAILFLISLIIWIKFVYFLNDSLNLFNQQDIWIIAKSMRICLNRKRLRVTRFILGGYRFESCCQRQFLAGNSILEY